MSIRWKLLALLLVISLIPLLFNSWFDQKVTSRAGRELGKLNRQVLMEGAKRNLIMMVKDYATIIRRERELMELILHVQAKDVERALASPRTNPGRVYFDENFDLRRKLPQGVIFSTEHFQRETDNVLIPLEVSYMAQSFRLAPGVEVKSVAREVAQLSAVLPTYSFLQRQHPNLLFWQATSLENGLQSAYPAHGNYPKDYDHRDKEWYIRALESGSLVWDPSPPRRLHRPDHPDRVPAGGRPGRRPGRSHLHRRAPSGPAPVHQAHLGVVGGHEVPYRGPVLCFRLGRAGPEDHRRLQQPDRLEPEKHPEGLGCSGAATSGSKRP